VATLTGTVTSDTARGIAGGDAAQIAGVRTVVNNLTVQTAASTPPSASVTTPAPEPIRTQPSPKPSAAVLRNTSPRPERYPEPQPAPIVRTPPAQPPMQQSGQMQAPPPPPPPPQPVAHTITIPAGTALPIRITQTLDSATTQQGDKFVGAVATDIIIDGETVLAQGTPVTGHVDAVQDAAHFKGSSLLTISLNSINRKGERLDVSTEPFTKQGEGRGKNTAEKVGGGAAVGAILGGIFGGGKGAAIGSAAGAGVGAGAQGMTRGQQVQIPSESIIRFKTTNSILVRVMTYPGNNEPGYSSPGLERRNP
ncbi:MAG: BON domain-containing protein, partial [Acidobacteriota bacterium]|nr:BON domain-containing protein [Acidobacteriota bacterium]